MFGKLVSYDVKGQNILFQYEKMSTRIEVISEEIINVLQALERMNIVPRQLKVIR